ncbi:hypothetical protein FH972_004719 [Carpinus fangiana]|uniref:Legume lectin domain-containing protein n=1 Tax=Carpinus fangiana TaxID=176857 RepID=A0A5N6QQH2_9ROSI|nr:hypothetical protein FH972_004719 [Carpinus fangiana]
MRLWDKESGNLADFTTHFSFVIDSQKKTVYGGGLAFFLAPNGSTMPDDITQGGDDQKLNSTNNHFVVVEFDIFSDHSSNTWDPPGEHVGIDINSMLSVANVSWQGSKVSIIEGKINEARISYNSTSHNLSVLFTGLINNATEWQSLYYIVDLRDHLPEWVTFGFSAATATATATAMHTIYTWNFSSEDIVTKPIVVAGNPSPNLAPNPRKNNGLGLAVGLGVGGSFLFGGLALILFFFWKRNRSSTEEDLALDSCMDEEFQRGTGPKSQSDVNSTSSIKFEKEDAAAGESSTLHNNSELAVLEKITTEAEDGSLSSESKENIDATKDKKLESNSESDGNDESSENFSRDESLDAVQHDPIDMTDSHIGLVEKEVRTDLDTLPEIKTEGDNSDYTAAE